MLLISSKSIERLYNMKIEAKIEPSITKILTNK